MRTYNHGLLPWKQYPVLFIYLSYYVSSLQPSKGITGQGGAIIRHMLTQHKLSDLQRQEPNVTRVIHLQSAP